MARILVLGAGAFGRLAAEELRKQGHEPRLSSRQHSMLASDANDPDSVARAARVVKADAIVHTAGPFQDAAPAAAQAAKRLRIPYVDIADDAAFAERVLRLGRGIPLLTGMSTTPAVAEALATLLKKRVPRIVSMRLGLFTAGGNRPGPATFRFASQARLKGSPETVDFPGTGRRRAYPAQAFFRPPNRVPGRTVVAIGGLGAIGWRFRWLARQAAWLGPRVPNLGRSTAGSLVVDGFDATGTWLGWEALHASEHAQRLAVLPAVWALDQAFRKRSPQAAVLPSDWVDPTKLVAFLESNRFERTTA